jgi:hypothetical protein
MLLFQKPEQKKKTALVVLPHGGVPSTFSSGFTNILRELLTQGYTIVAPETGEYSLRLVEHTKLLITADWR